MKHLVLAIAMVLGASIPLLSQNPACPIQPTLVKDVNSQISVEFVNMAAKQLQNYQFRLVFFDVNGGQHVFPLNLKGNLPVQARGRRAQVWNNALANQFLFPWAEAYVQHAVFADGTVWNDNGTHACRIVSGQE
jgi:hypothetical protein